jgi:hypothetical protein
MFTHRLDSVSQLFASRFPNTPPNETEKSGFRGTECPRQAVGCDRWIDLNIAAGDLRHGADEAESKTSNHAVENLEDYEVLSCRKRAVLRKSTYRRTRLLVDISQPEIFSEFSASSKYPLIKIRHSKTTDHISHVDIQSSFSPHGYSLHHLLQFRLPLRSGR